MEKKEERFHWLKRVVLTGVAGGVMAVILQAVYFIIAALGVGNWSVVVTLLVFLTIGAILAARGKYDWLEKISPTTASLPIFGLSATMSAIATGMLNDGAPFGKAAWKSAMAVAPVVLSGWAVCLIIGVLMGGM